MKTWVEAGSQKPGSAWPTTAHSREWAGKSAGCFANQKCCNTGWCTLKSESNVKLAFQLSSSSLLAPVINLLQYAQQTCAYPPFSINSLCVPPSDVFILPLMLFCTNVVDWTWSLRKCVLLCTYLRAVCGRGCVSLIRLCIVSAYCLAYHDCGSAAMG